MDSLIDVVRIHFRCKINLLLERPQSRRTNPLLLIYTLQFRSALHAATTPSQPQIRRALRSSTLVVL